MSPQHILFDIHKANRINIHWCFAQQVGFGKPVILTPKLFEIGLIVDTNCTDTLAEWWRSYGPHS